MSAPIRVQRGLQTPDERPAIAHADELAEAIRQGLEAHLYWHELGSGGNLAKNGAADYAIANGAKTLEMTVVGRALERLPYNPVTAKLWDVASAGFAATARGDAQVFISQAFRGAESVFGRIEGPTLNFKGNPIIQRFEDAW